LKRSVALRREVLIAPTVWGRSVDKDLKEFKELENTPIFVASERKQEGGLIRACSRAGSDGNQKKIGFDG